MEASILTQGLKRRGFIMGLAANCSDSEIAPFRNVDICFVFKIRKEFQASGKNVSSVAK